MTADLDELVRLLTRYGTDGSPLPARFQGLDWPEEAETMIGVARLRHLVECVRAVLDMGIPGDVMECGVWRGGACIAMKAVLDSYRDRTRQVWVCDSFCGLPPPNVERYPADEGDRLYTFDQLRVSEQEVRANFARYGLLDERVRFVAGWFKDSLPSAPVDKLALLRLDGDLYASTMETLEPMYPKVSKGGIVIIDDFGGRAQHQAVLDYREAHGITSPIRFVPGMSDGNGAWWRV